MDAIYRAGAAGVSCWSRNHHGLVRKLPMSRWLAAPDVAAHDRLADELAMNECTRGTILDLGCGPGQFTTALHHWSAAQHISHHIPQVLGRRQACRETDLHRH